MSARVNSSPWPPHHVGRSACSRSELAGWGDPRCPRPRSFNSAVASSIAACPIPSAWPEIPIRPESRARIATVKPWPSAANRFAAGTTTSSSTSSPVGDPFKPIFLNTWPTRTPGVSAGMRNALTPAARSSGPVRAKTIYRPAYPMLVMKTLVPLRMYPSPWRRALVFNDAASDPAAGSVSANAPRSSPDARRGSHRRFCSSVPKSRIGSLPTLVWTSTITEVDAQARASSSMQSAKARASRPAPPNSRGMRTPMRPASAAALTASSGNRRSRSTSAARGSATACASSRTESRKLACSGGRSKSIRGANYNIRLRMEAGPRYLEGTTVGSGRDIIGVRRDRIADIIGTGREIIARAKADKLLPETITGATAALLVTIAGYGEPLSEGQWRELAGVVGGIMRDSTYADLARLRTLITQEQFLNVARNQGYGRFIRRLDDGRWVCELAPKLEDLPDE